MIKKKKTSKLKSREALYGYLFVSPWVVGALIFVLIPLAQSFYYSLCNVKMKPSGRVFEFAGIANYQGIFLQDLYFVQSLLSYLLNTLLAMPVIVVFSLIIALLLNGKIKLKGFFRTVYFLPVIIVSGPVMSQLASQGAATIPSMNTNVITNILSNMLPDFMVTPIVNLFANMIMILWYSGVQILIYLAAIQKIDTSLYEAAKIDGGSGWECFWKITLPMIKPMTLLNAIYTVIFLSNNEQNSVINLIYTNMFAASRGYGFASAMAWMYAVIVTIIVGITALVLRPKKDNLKDAIKRERKREKQKERELKKLRRRQKASAKKIGGVKA
jgi:ABC-type sugar transport system permease subunit